MQELNTILKENYNCLFIAPTGWGKTTMLLELLNNSEGNRFIYFAPLRALCNEFYLRAKGVSSGVKCPMSKRELVEIEDFKLLILTPEICSEKVLFQDNITWIFDEFHLFYYWGNSFRPALLETYTALSFTQSRILLLTATAEVDVMRFWRESSRRKILINLGNHQIKKEALKRLCFLKVFKRKFVFFKGVEATLIFFKYRKEVIFYSNELQKHGFRVLSCVGGESHLFQEKLNSTNRVDFILATSTLSHGVNLPRISHLIITYKVNNFDLWTQMVGRAGRRGEEYILITRDHFGLSSLQRIKSLLKSYCYQWRFLAKEFIHECRRYYYS